jgi:hypothetical protein
MAEITAADASGVITVSDNYASADFVEVGRLLDVITRMDPMAFVGLSIHPDRREQTRTLLLETLGASHLNEWPGPGDANSWLRSTIVHCVWNAE